MPQVTSGACGGSPVPRVRKTKTEFVRKTAVEAAIRFDGFVSPRVAAFLSASRFSMKSRALRLTLIILAVSGITLLLRASLPTVATGTWVAAGTMAAARSGACPPGLRDGRQLVSGGADVNGPTNTADLFSTTGSWSAAAKMSSPRAYQPCGRLPDGRVRVA